MSWKKRKIPKNPPEADGSRLSTVSMGGKGKSKLIYLLTLVCRTHTFRDQDDNRTIQKIDIDDISANKKSKSKKQMMTWKSQSHLVLERVIEKDETPLQRGSSDSALLSMSLPDFITYIKQYSNRCE